MELIVYIDLMILLGETLRWPHPNFFKIVRFSTSPSPKGEGGHLKK